MNGLRVKLALSGGSGFLGQHLLERLKHMSCKVRLLVRRSLPGVATDVEQVRVHLQVPDSLTAALKGVDAVVHLAACNWREASDWATLVQVNQMGTRNLLQAAHRAGVERFLHCSSAGIHGLPHRLPLLEDDEVRPVSLLHRSLALGEAEALRGYPGMSVVVARPTGVYGPGSTNLLRFFQDVKSGRFLMLGQGRQRIHLSYVDDVVEGLLACLKRGRNQRAYFLGSPSQLQLSDWIRTVAEQLGVGVEPRWQLPLWPFKPFYRMLAGWSWYRGRESPWLHRLELFVRERECSLERARDELGFVPQWSAARGLERTLEWLQSLPENPADSRNFRSSSAPGVNLRREHSV